VTVRGTGGHPLPWRGTHTAPHCCLHCQPPPPARTAACTASLRRQPALPWRSAIARRRSGAAVAASRPSPHSRPADSISCAPSTGWSKSHHGIDGDCWTGRLSRGQGSGAINRAPGILNTSVGHRPLAIGHWPLAQAQAQPGVKPGGCREREAWEEGKDHLAGVAGEGQSKTGKQESCDIGNMNTT
jgi:hypothetical protein